MYRYLIKQRFCPTPIQAYSICAKTFHTVTYGAKSILVLNPLNVDHQSIRTSSLTRACCGAAESVKFTSLCQLWCEMGTFENVKQVSEQQSWFSTFNAKSKQIYCQCKIGGETARKNFHQWRSKSFTCLCYGKNGIPCFLFVCTFEFRKDCCIVVCTNDCWCAHYNGKQNWCANVIVFSDYSPHGKLSG